MRDIVKNNIILETCPTSNLRNGVVKNTAEMKKIIKTYLKHKIKFTINTDGPEMYCTNIAKEQDYLMKNGILTAAEIAKCTQWAFAATFLDKV